MRHGTQNQRNWNSKIDSILFLTSLYSSFIQSNVYFITNETCSHNRDCLARLTNRQSRFVAQSLNFDYGSSASLLFYVSKLTTEIDFQIDNGEVSLLANQIAAFEKSANRRPISKHQFENLPVETDILYGL